MIEGLGDMGASISIAAIGSALGAGAAGMSAVGAWKKCYAQSKAAPFMLVAFVGAPLTQTIYGKILYGAIKDANMPSDAYAWQLILGVLAGLGMGFSAWMQGRAAASASDAFAETGKGFGNYLIVLGIIETVALFVMVFIMTSLPK